MRIDQERIRKTVESGGIEIRLRNVYVNWIIKAR